MLENFIVCLEINQMQDSIPIAIFFCQAIDFTTFSKKRILVIKMKYVQTRIFANEAQMQMKVKNEFHSLSI